jgi:hypothetical protein
MFEKAAFSLRNLGLPSSTPLYAVVDGSRSKSGVEYEANRQVKAAARALLEKNIISSLILRDENFGTMNNVFASVTEVLNRHDCVFVLEDDLEVLPHANGLIELLAEQLSPRICAYGLYCNRSWTKNLFLSNRFSSQAWGTTRSAWQGFHPEDFKSLEITRSLRSEIKTKLGSDLVTSMYAFRKGKLDSWAVPWNIFNLLNDRLMLYPPVSYVKNNSHLIGAERTYGIEFDYEVACKDIDGFSVRNIGLNARYLEHFSKVSRFKRRLKAEIYKYF